MMAELSADSRQFIDYDLKADTLYYYYLTCVGDDQPGGIATPAGRLESSRFYTQTYDPVFIYVTTEINDLNEIVNTFSLNQNFPNPFNPSTIISWQSPVNGYQTLKVYDMLGREVTTLVNEYRNAGKYEIEFDASQLASGIYFYHLTVSALQSKDGNAGEYRSVKKMVLVK
jgi:hypothetical protein